MNQILFGDCRESMQQLIDQGTKVQMCVTSPPYFGLRDYGVKRNGNFHPTVKPTELMRYLCRLVTPKHGVVLDPFMGSGSTGKAAILEGFSFVGIEREAEYFGIAQARCQFVKEGISSKMPDQQDLFMEAY